MTTTSSSYVQRSDAKVTAQTRYDVVEKSTSYSSSSKSNNYSIVDASRVRAHGDGLLKAFKNEKATFTVDTRDAGK